MTIPSSCTKIFAIKKFLKTRLYHAGISQIEIERAANKAKINIHTARPGIVIGKKGAEIEKLKEEITKLTHRETYINIHEVRRPDLGRASWLRKMSRCSSSAASPFAAP